MFEEKYDFFSTTEVRGEVEVDMKLIQRYHNSHNSRITNAATTFESACPYVYRIKSGSPTQMTWLQCPVH